MITVSDTARTLINSGRYVYHVRASAWLGDQLLHDNVPIASGSEEGDRDLAVTDRVTLRVPRRAYGMDWTPTAGDSPLAARDQTLKISLGIGQGADEPEWFQRGEFLITETVPSGSDELAVTCASLLTLADEARFTTPFVPATTLGGTLRKLLEPSVLVDLTDAPGDRSITLTTVAWDTDRLAAVNEVLDAWPAEAVMTEQGILRVYPTTPPTEALRTFSDEAGGTVVSAAGYSRRVDPVTTVIATGYAADGAEVRTVYPVLESGPPGSLAGTPGRLTDKLRVPTKIVSGLLSNLGQTSATARFLSTRMARRYTLKRLLVETAPDPTIQLGDCVGVWAEQVWTLGTVETLDLPYTPGLMRLEVVALT